jgi:hypothetical protein
MSFWTTMLVSIGPFFCTLYYTIVLLDNDSSIILLYIYIYTWIHTPSIHGYLSTINVDHCFRFPVPYLRASGRRLGRLLLFFPSKEHGSVEG